MSTWTSRSAASPSSSSSTCSSSAAGSSGSTRSRSPPASSAKLATSRPNSPGCHSGCRAVQRHSPGPIRFAFAGSTLKTVFPRPAVRALVGIGLVAGCALALQVLLTRLFSAVLFYHFGFLAISLALLGTGVGGLLLYVRPQWFERQPLTTQLMRWSLLLSGLLVVVPLLLVRLDYHFSGSVSGGVGRAPRDPRPLAARPCPPG